MDFLKAGEPVESNIFNQLDEKKRALIEKGVDVINLSIGTPDFQPDKHVMEAVSRAALDPDMYKYSLTETPELLDAVEKWYKRRYDVDLADDEIIQVSGSQEGFAHIGFAFAGPNDLILAPDPGYPIFTFGPLMTGATIALYPLREENNWQLDFNDIPEDIAERAKAIVVSYPNNPTTAVADRAFYEKLVTFAREHNMIVLHDNAYSDLMLDGTDGLSFLSIPGAKEVGVEFNSLSKTYNLTGMRVSFVVGNRDLIAKFRAFRSQIDYGTFYPIQAGAVAALNGPQDIVKAIARVTWHAVTRCAAACAASAGTCRTHRARCSSGRRCRRATPPRRSSRSNCSKRPALSSFRAAPSASTARDTCAWRLSFRPRECRKPSAASAKAA